MSHSFEPPRLSKAIIQNMLFFREDWDEDNIYRTNRIR